MSSNCRCRSQATRQRTGLVGAVVPLKEVGDSTFEIARADVIEARFALVFGELLLMTKLGPRRMHTVFTARASLARALRRRGYPIVVA